MSENAKFAEQLAQEGIVFIGPPSSAIVSMGSKRYAMNVASQTVLINLNSSESKNIMLGKLLPSY